MPLDVPQYGDGMAWQPELPITLPLLQELHKGTDGGCVCLGKRWLPLCEGTGEVDGLDDLRNGEQRGLLFKLREGQWGGSVGLDVDLDA